ncbi:small glutamine rich tetratricopeptide repeat-containing partial [Plasmopara halstedii]|uniref:Small glutamine rich tetratricopeptide repeat-containing partial n=1 Tax=Plasmopara halstedii TaxID=4781 RepID=A0A0N7L4S4_PLAHL|nr:small glutamine rich tetratricopeptide repeat-containing partial [Plasmopara halstedii]CEG39483.1 small glutamine rich tetratricopeptide repeat-containing partial [Plasmopara halstedii]
MSSEDDAEVQKTLGNEEFNHKNFSKAVECYSEAIRLNSNNYVYYSNRSAAYGAMGNWELAEKDAQECVKRNPTFAKGYHRLANAQQQLGRKKEAIETLKIALTAASNPDKVPGIKKLLRQLNEEVTLSSTSSPQGVSRQVPAHVAKELQELQPQFQKIQHESDQIEAKLAAFSRQKKRLALVERELIDLPEGIKTYRSIGKMFMQTGHDENAASVTNENKLLNEQMSSLEARKNYLNRQKQSVQNNITELLAQCT